MAEAVKKIGVTEQTYYRWKKKCGGLRIDQAKRRTEPEKENARPRRHVPDDEPRLVKRIVWLACAYGRYGYRRSTVLLRSDGWRVNHKRAERIWRDQGLKSPQKQPARKRRWFNDGSCIRLRPTHRSHVWSFRRVVDRTSDGRPIRMLTIVDEFARECLAIGVAACNTVRPHSALGYRPPAPETWQPCAVASATTRQPHRAGLIGDENLT